MILAMISWGFSTKKSTFRLSATQKELFGISNYRGIIRSLVLKNAIRKKHRIFNNKPEGIVCYGITDKPIDVNYISI